MERPDLIAAHAQAVAAAAIVAVVLLVVLRLVTRRTTPAASRPEPLMRTPNGMMTRGLERKLVYVERHADGWAVCNPVPLAKPIWLPADATRVRWSDRDAGTCQIKHGRWRLHLDATLARAFV